MFFEKNWGGGVPSNLFACNPLTSAGTSWQDWGITGTVNDPNSTGVGVMLDPKFGHIDTNGNIAVDMAIPNAYITGRALAGRNSSGTLIYGGIRLLKNGTLITGASCYGSSSDNNPYFRRVETSLAVGDVLKVQLKNSVSGNIPRTFLNICTDD